MILYKITTLDSTKDGNRRPQVFWVGSKAKGVEMRKELAGEGWVRKEITEVEVDVPTDKSGLLNCLNMLANT